MRLGQQASFVKAKILVKQIKALGISQERPPFKLNVIVTSEGMDWALRQRQQKERLWKGAETRYIPTEQQLLAVYTMLLQAEHLMKELHTTVNTSLPI